jgi:short subunit dehydrogenase-like uncharacterized protein
MDPRIVVLGATGYTGSLIAERLAVAGLDFIACARDADRGRALRTRTGGAARVALVDVREPAGLAGVLDGARIVVNCVGPYNIFGGAVLDACRHRDLVYIDLAGEQDFVRRSFDHADRPANGGTCSVLHSIAFESTVADLLAADLLGQHDAGPLHSISSYYAFSKSRPSPGTHLTMRLARSFPTHRFSGGSLRPAAPLSFEEEVALTSAPGLSVALFMPYPEVLFFARRYAPAEAASFLLVSAAEAHFARAARERPPAAVDVAAAMAQHDAQRRDGPGAAERHGQQFTVAVRVVDADGNARTRAVRGRDMYALTAALVAHVVEAVAAGVQLPPGTPTPSELPVWDGIWTRLEAEGLSCLPGDVT